MKFAILTSLLFSLSAAASYEEHFPTYFEYCTGSQVKTKSGYTGGPAGHGFTYIHGLCKDYRDTYPQVLPCSEVSKEMREKHPHEGVGISLDKNFSNVSWVAVPGRDLLLFGEKERKAISNADVDEVVKRITDLQVLQDVKMKPKNLENLQLNSKEYLRAAAIHTLGTDYAVNWGRELHCVKIPVPAEKIKLTANFLNETNLQYKNGPGFEWSMISDNCANLSANISNMMDINASMPTNQFILKQLFNIGIPNNTYMMYADKAVLKKPSLNSIEKEVKKKGFSNVQVGSLMNKYDVYPSGDVFDTENSRMMTAPRYGNPLKFLETPRKYVKRMREDNTELKANAQKWTEIYDSLLKKMKKEESPELRSYLEKQKELSKSISANE